jgi:tRNA pseudouridine32 synthase/23S rRNA pseudouridine746 synthase
MPPSRLQLPPGDWPTLLDGLVARFPHIDRATWLERFARGRVQDSAGAALAPDAAYRTGLEVRYFREVPDEAVIPGEERVLHVDAHLVVADKPHGLPVVPSGRYVRETLLARLGARLARRDLVPLHRIDRDTAGLVLFSADPSTRDAYQALFRERRIDKRYRAIAPALPELAFPYVHRSRLRPGEPFFRMQEVEGAPDSETHIDVLRRDGPYWTYALVPVTGRKHQLRVHMASLGAPIVGDRLYPVLSGSTDDPADPPLALLAQSLAFVDPLSGALRRFESARTLASPDARQGTFAALP